MIWLVSGCLTVDSLLPFHKAVHCSEVSEETCENQEEYWDKVCIPCEEDYSWDAEFSWRDMTIAEYEGITVSDILEGGSCALPVAVLSAECVHVGR